MFEDKQVIQNSIFRIGNWNNHWHNYPIFWWSQRLNVIWNINNFVKIFKVKANIRLRTHLSFPIIQFPWDDIIFYMKLKDCCKRRHLNERDSSGKVIL